MSDVPATDPIDQVLTACTDLARDLMRLNPAIGRLPAGDARNQAFETAYRITTDVETIKKAMLKLRRKDDSTDL